MLDSLTVAAAAREFHDAEDGAAMKSLELILQLLECSLAPFSRDQFTPGHITCSGMVLAPNEMSILLVHHRRLDRWLVPGGHVEPDDPTIADAARREVVEETGAMLNSWSLLAGADVHGIPAKRGEPYHLHHDLLFAFQATKLDISVSEESHAVVWCSEDEFARYAVPENVRRAYERLM
jgi:8-oxo-dGTP pyrophosphatase MutT (NUDIX family)